MNNHLFICTRGAFVRILLAVFMFCFSTSAGLAQTRYYVDSAHGNDSYSGSSWSSAYRNLTKALAAANTSSAGEIDIWVAKGTYTPVEGITSFPFDYRDTSFALCRGNGIGRALKLYGGFAGTETSVAARDTFHRSRLNGVISSSQRSYHVAVIAGIAGTADSIVVDGFTISNGYASDLSDRHYNSVAVTNYCGGGLFMANDSSSKTVVRRCRIINNQAIDTGGTVWTEVRGAGIYCLNATATFESCDIMNNKCGKGVDLSYQSAFGGGMYIDSSVCGFANCNFAGNVVVGDSPTNLTTMGGSGLGGAIYGIHSSLSLSDCIFSNDSANGGSGFSGNAYGAGIYAYYTSTVLTNCTFNGNCANGTNSWGGGIYSFGSSWNVSQCHFNNNLVAGDGSSGWATGGAFYGVNDSTSFRNSVFNGNSATRRGNGGAGGGAINSSTSSLALSNCHFTSNNAFSALNGGVGGALLLSDSVFTIDSCTFDNNSASDSSSQSAGGAIQNTGGMRGRIAHCAFNNNTTYSHSYSNGGAIISWQCSLKISDCSFSGNRAISIYPHLGEGGAIYSDPRDSSAMFYRCRFTGNRATQNGGAICQASGTAIVRSCDFVADTSFAGGALYVNNYSFSFISCSLSAHDNIFKNNVSYGGGGAIWFLLNGGYDSLYNNIFLFNKDFGTVGGGALRIKGDAHWIVNNIFYSDSALAGGTGGAIRFDGTSGNYKIANNIFYKNGKAGATSDTNFVPGSTYTFTHNTYGMTNPAFLGENSPEGPDNIWRTADDGFHIYRCSPARDAGLDTFADNSELTDITAAPRIAGSHVDLGAYESSGIGSITGIHTLCIGSSTILADTTIGGHWLSSDTAIARIGSTGVTTGIGVGTCHIMYVVSDGCGTDTATAVIHVTSPADAGSITGTMHVCVDATTLLSDTVADGTWSATNGHATVSNGLVTGVTAGTDTIIYTNSCGTGRAYAYITVYPTPHTGPITGPLAVCTGGYILLSDTTAGGVWSSDSGRVALSADTVRGLAGGLANVNYIKTNSFGCADTSTTLITVIVTPTAGTLSGYDPICRGVPTTWHATHPLGIWSTADPAIAIVSTAGVITGIRAGATTIHYLVSNACGMATDSATIHIEQPAAAISGLVNVCIGNSFGVTDSAANGIWTSSNTTVATISPTGVITGLAGGYSIISYTVINACGLSYVSNVATIDQATGPITGGDTLCLYGSITLSNVAPYGFWTCSDPTVATIDATGLLTGLTPGIATVFYSLTNTCGSFTESENVVVVTSPFCDSVVAITALPQTTTITIHPNPATATIHIIASTVVDVELTDMEGKIQLHRQRTNTINVANLPAGMYLLNIYDAKGLKLKTERIVRID